MTMPFPPKSTVAALAVAAGFVLAATPAVACSEDSYMGTICTFGFGYCPTNWVPADGRLLPMAQYQALYSLFSTTYGGDGRTTFGVPDLRGRAAIGSGQGNNLPPVKLGAMVGQPQAQVPVPLPQHGHQAIFEPTGTVTVATVQPGSGAATVLQTGSGGNVGGNVGGTVAVQPAGTPSPAVTVPTQSPAVGLTVCVMTAGVYPVRP